MTFKPLGFTIEHMIIAYSEYPSADGTLRFEYRARRLRQGEFYDAEDSNWVLERRRVLDGVPGGWDFVGFGETRIDLWSHLDPGLTITDPKFQAYQANSSAVIAYSERQSVVTDGVLRFEYRARRLREEEPELRRRFRSYVEADWALERRRILDGVPEGWALIDVGKARIDLWSHLDSGVVITDPEFQARQAQHEAEIEVARVEAAERAIRQQEIDEAAAHSKRSEAAFDRLAQGKDGHWAEAWVAFAERARAVEGFVECAQSDARCVELFNAVLSTTTVPAKRAAIKRALAHFERRLADFQEAGSMADDSRLDFQDAAE